MIFYNKVIRDQIPKIIEKSGKNYEVKKLNDEEYLNGLIEKLVEETNEFLEDEDINELADILEVIYAIARLKGISKKQLEEMRRAKEITNGGFNENLYLVKTYE